MILAFLGLFGLCRWTENLKMLNQIKFLNVFSLEQYLDRRHLYKELFPTLTHSYIDLFTNGVTDSLTHSQIHLLTHSQIHSLIHSPTQSLTHSLADSLTHKLYPLRMSILQINKIKYTIINADFATD